MNVRKGARAKDFEIAIQWLVDAGLVYKVNRVRDLKVPLRFYSDSNAFSTTSSLAEQVETVDFNTNAARWYVHLLVCFFIVNSLLYLPYFEEKGNRFHIDESQESKKHRFFTPIQP